MEFPESRFRIGADETLAGQAIALLREGRRFLSGGAGGAEAWRGAQFDLLRRGDRNTVLRARLASGHDGIAPTLVLKFWDGDVERADADLQALTALAESGVVPRIIAEDAATRGFAMEDLGDDRLEDRLQGDDRAGAWGAVEAMGEVYARLHVEGRAHVVRTGALRAAGQTRDFAAWAEALPRALAWLALEGDDPRVQRAVRRIMPAWYASRESLTLTHGDPAPTNVLFDPSGRARLIDFEYAGARPPAYDETAWEVLCPLPEAPLRRLRSAYAAARAAMGWPIDPDAHAYEALVAYRALALLSWLPASARERDRAWVGAWRVRQAVVHALERLAGTLGGDAELQPLADAGERAARRWRAAWQLEGTVRPVWPALEG